MLTIDDANSIIKKYGDVGFWYTINCNDFDIQEIISTTEYFYFKYDTFKIRLNNYSHGEIYIRVYIDESPYATHIGYAVSGDGDFAHMTYSNNSLNINIPILDFEDSIINIYVTTNPTTLSDVQYLWWVMFVPLSSLQIPVINGEFDNKFYIKKVTSDTATYYVGDTEVSLLTDEKGTYFLLPSATNTDIKGKTSGGTVYSLFNLTFMEFKGLPLINIPTLYRGTPQTIQVINYDTEEPITEFQSYYQGRLLRDNQINLPYNAPDYIDIVVDLKDPEYPYTRVKLKAPTTIYTANSQSDVETAIENGVQTLQIGDNETEVTLNNITLNNVTLINSNIQLSESTLTQCRIINTEYTDNGLNNITNTIFETTNITSTETSTIYTECTLTESTITNTELHITGTLTENTFNNSLIISDGIIRIINNTFNGVGEKTYFPSHLYLTGDYTVTGNTFTLTGEWTELEFNICLIKTLNTFNPSEFINTNTLHLNITYETEPTNTLYYNIIDDDKIKAVKLQ